MKYTSMVILLLTQAIVLLDKFVGSAKLPSELIQGNYHVHPVANNRRKMILQSENGKMLIMRANGRLKGETNFNIVRRCGKFEIRSHAPGKVSIFNVRRRMYVAINKTGRQYGSKVKSLDIYFRVSTDMLNAFVSYHSLFYSHQGTSRSRRWYLAIKDNGDLRKPSTRTSGRRRSTLFLPLNFAEFKKRVLKKRRLKFEAKLRKRQRRNNS